MVSVDEAFIDLTYEHLHPEDRRQWCASLKETILKEVGVPVSIGLSATKILAKLCADYRKPLGERVASTPQEVRSLLESVDVQKIVFVGPATAEKLAPFCKNAYDIVLLGPDRIKSLLGMHGLKIRYELSGISLHMKKIEGAAHSIGRVRSFNPHFTADKTTVRRYLCANLEKAVRELHDQHQKTRCIKVFLKSKDRQKSFAKKQLAEATDSYEELLKIVQRLFEEAWIANVLWRRTGVVLRDLSSAAYTQVSLFSAEHTHEQSRLDEAMHRLNTQRGKRTVTRGYIGQKDRRASRPVREMMSGIQ